MDLNERQVEVDIEWGKAFSPEYAQENIKVTSMAELYQILPKLVITTAEGQQIKITTLSIEDQIEVAATMRVYIEFMMGVMGIRVSNSPHSEYAYLMMLQQRMAEVADKNLHYLQQITGFKAEDFESEKAREEFNRLFGDRK